MLTLFFAGGGTLGPVTPLLAVYQELKHINPNLRVVWVGTKTGPEREKMKLFPEISFESLPESKLDRFFSLRLFIAPLQFFAALLMSVILIIRYRPSLIVGSGGFMQVPLMWVGKQFGVSCVIHQLDVTPTLSNKLCAWTAKKITVNFEVTAKHFPKEKASTTGNPVLVPDKAEFETEYNALTRFSAQKPLLVVMGGGTGAGQLNSLIGSTINELSKTFNITLVSGGRFVPKSLSNRDDVVVTNFVQDTYHLLEQADVVVTRAGIATLTEVACLGKPTVIVPIPHSHQEANARYFEEKAAAEVFWCDYHETEKRADEFVEIIQAMWTDEGKKDQLVKNIGKLYNKNATKLITDEMLKTLNTKH